MNIRRLAHALVVVACAAAVVPTLAPAQGTAGREPGAIVGRVLESGRPASGVRVLAVAAGYSETTGGDGRFRMDDVPPGVHLLTVVHPDFGTDSVRATVADGTTTGLTLRYGEGERVRSTLHLGGLPDYDAGVGGEAATGRSRVVGELIDRKSSEPIASASVRLPDLGRQAQSSDEGRFVFDSLPAGRYTVRIDHVRYGTQTAEVQVPRRRTVDAEIRLAPQAIEMDPIQVSVDVRSPSLTSAGYYQRRDWGEKTGYGHFLEHEELDRRGNRLSNALGTIPNLKIGQFGSTLSGSAKLPYFPRHRNFAGACLPAVYLDGQKITGSGPAEEVGVQFGPRGIDALANLAEVAAVEVYPSPSATAGEFQGADSNCGVVVIWTGRGTR